MVADPENWYIVDGQLYLHHSKEGRDKAFANPKPVIAKAEETWKRLQESANGQGNAANANR
jgi:hypothetical protein